MSIVGEQILLRVFVQSADRAWHVPTYGRIVKAARTEKLAGATVLEGILGFGHRGVIRASAVALVKHVPIVVEIVDSAEKIAQFVARTLDPIMTGGMITLERAAVMMYRQRQQTTLDDLRLAAAALPLATVPKIQPGNHMTIQENGVLLRVFIGESDKFERLPLHEAIVGKARELGLAGATVLRGTEGFGANTVVHKTALLEMSSDLPVVIEIADTKEKIESLLPHLQAMVGEGMITMEYVHILLYRHTGSPKP